MSANDAVKHPSPICSHSRVAAICADCKCERLEAENKRLRDELYALRGDTPVVAIEPIMPESIRWESVTRATLQDILDFIGVIATPYGHKRDQLCQKIRVLLSVDAGGTK